ncbi:MULTISPECIES: hypothetical protein [Nostocales]|nr:MULTISPECIES: hypothetical protein [Nostocales]
MLDEFMPKDCELIVVDDGAIANFYKKGRSSRAEGTYVRSIN